MSAKQKSAKRMRPDPNYFREHLENEVRARRRLCSSLGFWRACGHKRCLRARACGLKSNECYRRLWPLVPEWLKISLRAGMKAQAAGLSKLEVAAAIARETARWDAMQEPPATVEHEPEPAASAPPAQDAAPERPSPRIRALR